MIHLVNCLCFSNSVCELLILKLQSPSIIIIIIYRPPSCLDCDFIDVISRAEQYILTVPAPLPYIILLGDFNFPLINWSNPNSQYPLSSPLFHFSNQLFLSQQVAKPTRNANIYVSDRRGRLCSVSHVRLGHTGTLAYSSFRWKGIRLFNSLPMHIRNITACPPLVFKKQLDLHLSPILDCPCTPNFNNSLDNKY